MVYWSTGGKTPDGRTASEYEQEGSLLIGVGGGRFDEHPTAGAERKQDECTTTLVAKELGINDVPAFKQILKYVLQNDLNGAKQTNGTNGSAHLFDLATTVKLMHKYHDPKKVMEWALLAIQAKYDEQYQFCNATKEAFEKCAKVETTPGPRGPVTMVSIHSDDELMNRFARSLQGASADIIIQQRSLGYVQIFTNKKSGLTLYDVAKMIRMAEQRAKGGIVKTIDYKLLSAEGTVLGCEEWHFHYGLQMLTNSSLTASNVPPTRLSLDQILEIVRIGINPKAFEPKRAELCEGGNCTSAQGNRCPWECYHLCRCFQVRQAMNQKKQLV